MYSHKLKKYIDIILLMFCILLIFLFTLRFVTTFDENYTLKIINFNYEKLLKLDTIDVHPPLYYLFLKFYLNIFTFWTKSILIKIIFARLLSVILFLLTFMILHVTLKQLGIKINWLYQLTLFLLLPNVSGINAMSNEQLVDIRMYGLAAFILSVIIYCTVKYSINYKNKYIFEIIVFSIISLYINYYLALSVGILILFNCISYLFKIDIRSTIKFLIIDVLLVICYIPWIPIIIKQSKASDSIFYYVKGDLLKQSAVFLIIFLIFSYPIIFYLYKINRLFRMHSQILFGTLIFSFIIPIIISLIKRPMFRFRYLYPILLVYEFVSISLSIKLLKNSNAKNKLFSLGLVLLLICSISISMYDQIFNLDPQSIQIMRNIYKWNHMKSRIVTLNPRDNKFNGGTQTNLNTQYAFYLSSKHKEIKCKGLKIPNSKDYLPLYNSTIKHIHQ